MAKIKCKGNAAQFTGHIGPVAFINGEAETELPSMLLHFQRDPERYEVTEGDAEQPEDEQDEQPEGESDEDPEDEHDEDDEPRDGDGYVHDGTEDEHPAPGSDADPYDVNVQALRKMASERGLPQAGSKSELQARIREHDAAQTESTDDNDGE